MLTCPDGMSLPLAHTVNSVKKCDDKVSQTVFAMWHFSKPNPLGDDISIKAKLTRKGGIFIPSSQQPISFRCGGWFTYSMFCSVRLFNLIISYLAGLNWLKSYLTLLFLC